MLNALGTVPPFFRGWMRYNIFDDFWAKGLRARAGLEQIGRDAFLKRKSTISKELGFQRRDLLSFLFNAIDPDTGKPLLEEEIVAEAISFIVGGSDTTSSTMTNFIDLVSRDSVVTKRLQRELDEAFPDTSLDWIAPESKLLKLPYLNATLREVMRYRPTSATGLERLTPPGGRVISGRLFPGRVSITYSSYQICLLYLKANTYCTQTLLSVPTMSILHDENIYPRPNEFDPQRWLAQDTSQMLEYFQPFSYGPRSCIGRKYD